MWFTESFELTATLLAISFKLSAVSKNKCRTDGLSFVFTDSSKLRAMLLAISFELSAFSKKKCRTDGLSFGVLKA